MDTEDFSFPTIGTRSSGYIDSPPLWRMSPAASPAREGKKQYIHEDKYEDKADYLTSNSVVESYGQGKRFSYVMVKGDSQDSEDDVEEKMDMLWEDFNEESTTKHNSKTTSCEMIETGCGRDMNLAKPGGTFIWPKKAGMVILVKVLKGLLTMHSQRSPKKPA